MLHLLNLSQLRFIPCALPLHRSLPSVSAYDRAAMLELAIEDEPRFVCDRREISRLGPSFTIDTLAEVREELGPDLPLIFLMGSDVFHTIDTWRHWEKLLAYVHLFIVDRPTLSAQFPDHIWKWLRIHRISDLNSLNLVPNGRIFMTSVNALQVSATEVRNLLYRRLPVNQFLPSSVFKFVQQNNLYLDDVNNESEKTSFVQKNTISR